MSPRKPTTAVPWFPFYFDRWLDSPAVLTMSHALRGVFIHLLAHQARMGELPADPKAIGALVSMRGKAWRDAWGVLAAHFPVTECGGRANGSLIAKMDSREVAACTIRETMRALGERSAARRKSLNGTAQPSNRSANRSGNGSANRSANRSELTNYSVKSSSRSSHYPARDPILAPTRPPTPANAKGTKQPGARPIGEVIGEIIGPLLAAHAPDPETPDTTGHAGPGLEAEGAA